MLTTCSSAPSSFLSTSTPLTTIMTSSEHVHNADIMCRYPSKTCWNPRALKRNGEHHNLCDFHRQKANKNQRRLELKRKARALAATDMSATVGKHPRVLKKTRQRSRRGPLSAHLVMKEATRDKQQAEEETSRAMGPTSWFLQDLVLFEGGYDRAGFQVKEELPIAPPSCIELPRLPDVVDEETLERFLQDGQGDVYKGFDSAALGLDPLASMSDGKTSPVDVGEYWDNLGLGDCFFPADQAPVNIDPFIMDEDVFVADV